MVELRYKKYMLPRGFRDLHSSDVMNNVVSSIASRIVLVTQRKRASHFDGVLNIQSGTAPLSLTSLCHPEYTCGLLALFR